MRTGIVAFVMGNICFLYFLPLDCSVQHTPIVQTVYGLLVLIFVCVLLLYKPIAVFVSLPTNIYIKFYQQAGLLLVMFAVGYLYTAIDVNYLYPQLDLSLLEGKTIKVKGYIASIPEKSEKKISFQFNILAREKNDHKGDKLWDESFKAKVKLSWYYNRQQVSNGQYWQLNIRLKKPNGMLNGGFDYEQWLYQHRILATGYIRQGKQLADEIDQSTGQIFAHYFAQLRQKIARQLDYSLADYRYLGLIKALTIGLKSDITNQQWQSFLRTGTNHLVAISGLHISLMAGLIWWLVRRLWCAAGRLNLYYPANSIASICAFLAAVFYAALSGFALPAQRALIMLFIVFVAIILRREIRMSYVLLVTLLIVLLFDPLSPLSAGFWLSFLAVAIIFISTSSRLTKNDQKNEKLRQIVRLQFIIFIGLMAPLTILFQQFSLIAPLANLIAVPLMSFLIVPVSLLAGALLFVYQPLAILIFTILSWPIDGLFYFLQQLSQLSISQFYLSALPPLLTFLLIIGSLCLLLPRGWPGKWLGIILVFPALSFTPEKIPIGQFELIVFDVGQGLSMLVKTRNHYLLYDTGDKFSTRFNMADVVIIPYLQHQAISLVDTLIVSHSDRDHAGSYNELMMQVNFNRILAGEPELLNVKSHSIVTKNMRNKNLFTQACVQGQKWQWDHVQFTVLAPKANVPSTNNNNQSCVIHIIDTHNRSLLLTGDIEKNVEKQLIKDYPQLRVDVLQVPHHGSGTSSSADFLSHIQPDIALFSFGYKNRFHHPQPAVVQRYKEMHTNLYNTSNGAIEIQSNITNNSFSVIEYRVQNNRFWHREINRL